MTTQGFNIAEELKSHYERIKNIEQQLVKNNKKIMKKFKLRHKIIFAAVVFFGAVLLWYGLWSLISEIPFLNNPFVSIGVGLGLLLGTGMYYDNTL